MNSSAWSFLMNLLRYFRQDMKFLKQGGFDNCLVDNHNKERNKKLMKHLISGWWHGLPN